jgi:uncharacterized protein YbjT (DUF2867 family)
MKTAVIAGATGLIGNALLQRIVDSKRYTQVVVIGRRVPELVHEKIIPIISHDFNNLDENLSGRRIDDVFCCLGTTMAKAGSREKFYEVDYHFPVRLAQAALGLGAKQYLIVTALGADNKSSIFYNRVKGEVEEALKGIGYSTVHIFRPSLLLGERDEKRAGEDMAKKVYRFFNFLIPRKYKAIEGSRVAEAMLDAAAADRTGIFVHSSAEMQARTSV